MERDYTNIVSSFFYYMWNMWSEEECHKIFGAMGDHIWSKWCNAYDRMKGPWGAAEYMYGELDSENRELLVEHACKMYDNGRRIK